VDDVWRVHTIQASAYEDLLTDESRAEQLGTTNRFVVVLGLVVDQLGRVLYGEVVDLQAEGRYRFVGPDGIAGAVGAWLREHPTTSHRDEP
jgi:hypothetical protein